MNKERWDQIQALYYATLERQPSQRPQFLTEGCEGDSDLRREVESLLAHEGQADELLERPVWNHAAAAVPNSARSSPRVISAGSKIGVFEIIELLGVGGMGAVYRATDTKLNREVAIKVLPDQLAGDPQYIARFTREAQVLASLNHPNISILHGVEDNALVMELVPGPTVEEMIASGPLPYQETLRIARQIADALEAAHDKGVIHRDLKPANVKVTPAGIVKVLDFGLAKAGDPAGGSGPDTATRTLLGTKTGVIMGTAGYMAPEQAAGKKVDKRVDIWAFGVVLYEMLTGERLFEGPSFAHILSQVLTKEFNLAAIDPAVRPLLRRCLQRDPRERLRDIGEARLSLDELANPGSAGVAQPTSAPRVRSSQLVWIAAGLALTLIPLSLGWFRRSTEPLKPLIRFDVNPGPGADAGSLLDALAISPDGSRLIYGTRDKDGQTRLSTRLLDEPEGSPIPGTEGANHPTVSVDGQWLSFGAKRRRWKLSLNGGSPQDLGEPDDVARWIRWSWADDGSLAYAPGIRTPIYLLPPSGGAPHAITTLTGQDVTHRNPFIASNSAFVVFTSNTHGGNHEDADIVAQDLKTNRRVTLHRGGYSGRYIGPPEGPGFLLYVSRGTAYAMSMNPITLTVVEPPTPVISGISSDFTTGLVRMEVSRNGTVVYLKGSSGELPALSTIDSEQNVKPLVSPGLFSGPRLSPDGKRVLFLKPAGERELWLLDVARGTSSRLTFTGKATSTAAWSPDGAHIIYSDDHKMWWARADGGDQPQMLLDRVIVSPAVLPDGRNIIGSDGKDLFSISLDDAHSHHPRAGTPKAFANSPALERFPAASPDGKWIAYSSDETGQQEVFVRPFPGPGGKWQISAAGGEFPTWSQNELFYQDSSARVMAVPYRASSGNFQAGKPRVWLNRPIHYWLSVRNYDVAADSKQFVALLGTDPANAAKTPGVITVLLNFFDELRRRVGPR